MLVAPMVPSPGEAGADWWSVTGHSAATAHAAAENGRPDGDDPALVFFHDLPDDVVAEAAAHARSQSDRPFVDPWPLDAWPDVETHVVIGRHDRFLPAEFQRRIVRDRLGLTPDEIDGGHLLPLASPRALADYLRPGADLR